MIRVLIVDDHTVVRAGLCNLLAVEPDIVPVASVPTMGEALAAFEQESPDVVVADYRLADGDGLTLCRHIERSPWPAEVLIFSGYADHELAVAAAVAGATGLLGKGASGEALFDAVRAVAAGASHRIAVPPRLIGQAAERLEPDDLPILGLRLEWCSPREIADVMKLPLSTVLDRIDAIVDTLRPRIAGMV
jgi:DNA-binding NarL/FixJ family response regulator